ncbi:class I adenylate-forming enzyme family protein [Nonomuraea lactucae]|uniref:class I adenylate-forming enzyme family protein n=1 Tax=Nonomuraea lactucae TaxID=2249762 RepID=UPI000DE3F09C|nr:class I adenylate-forming enzyme family protein [Nonomuraea lactucae]
MAAETRTWWGADILGRGAASAVWARVPHEVTLGQLRERITERATALRARGAGRGSTVALCVPPGVTQVETLFAAWSLGAQVILVDHRSSAGEFERVLSLCEPQYVLSPAATPGKATAILADEHHVRVERRVTGRSAESDICLVQFSSGSTGAPKAVGRSSGSLLAELDRYAALEGMPGRGERLVLLNSLTHTMGLVGGLLHALNAGVELVFPARINPADVLQSAAETGAHAIFGVPVHFDLLSRRRHRKPPALRLAVSAGEMLPQEVYDRFADAFGTTIRPVYGTTETGLVAADLAGGCAPPCVGTPTRDMRVRELAGELHVALERSPYLYTEQHGRYDDGWLRTFDRCVGEARTGHLHILGRTDSVVVVGGLKVDLGEVEAVLRGHPSVREAVVVCDATIEAYVGGDETLTADLLARWCRDRLSDFKIPRRFHLAAAVPRNPDGKIIRRPELLRMAFRTANG